jgi:hypothetical protein
LNSNEKEKIGCNGSFCTALGADCNLSFGKLCKCISKSEPGCWKSNLTESFDLIQRTNKQNSEANFDLIINLNGQTTNQRLEWDAELLDVLSTKQKPELLSSQPVQIDEEIIQRSPNATNTILQTSFVFYPVCKCHKPMKLHTSPGAILYYLPIW